MFLGASTGCCLASPASFQGKHLTLLGIPVQRGSLLVVFRETCFNSMAVLRPVSCKRFERGTCNAGQGCKFAHAAVESALFEPVRLRSRSPRGRAAAAVSRACSELESAVPLAARAHEAGAVGSAHVACARLLAERAAELESCFGGKEREEGEVSESDSEPPSPTGRGGQWVFQEDPKLSGVQRPMGRLIWVPAKP